MTCTAGLCKCSRCGTSGYGDLTAALERARLKIAESRLRDAARTASRPPKHEWIKDGLADLAQPPS